MLKIIDVAAGVAARRHTDLNCVTISVDRVILVREIRSGDVIHVDACINRAWGSSIGTEKSVYHWHSMTKTWD